MTFGHRELSWPALVTLLFARFLAAAVALGRHVRVVLGVEPAVSPARYRLTRKLGEGGMGVVYEGRAAAGQGKVAVKLIRGETNPRRLARFEREIEILESVRHRNVVALRDHGTTPDGERYLAMELLDGVDLQRVVDERGPQTPRRVVSILLELCEALAAVHDAGVVHRDIKPANVFLCRGQGGARRVKLLDFGLAARTGETSGESDDEIVGSPYAMAPECFTTPGAVGPLADLYAVGVLAYTLLSGAPPFASGGLIDIAAQHLYAQPPSLSGRGVAGASAQLGAVIARCLEKSPERRPVSARALLRALRACPEASALVAIEARSDVCCEHASRVDAPRAGQAARFEESSPRSEGRRAGGCGRGAAGRGSRERRALADTRRALRSTEVDARDRFGTQLARQARSFRARAA